MEIYAEATDEGLQPFYTYTLAEIIEQYEYDGNRMPIGKVYVKYDEDEVKATIAKREAWNRQEDERQKKIEEEKHAYDARVRKFEANHPILFKLVYGALDLFWWFMCYGFMFVGLILAVVLFIYCFYTSAAADYGWPTFTELMGHRS